MWIDVAFALAALLGGAGIIGCASGPGPADPVEGAPSTVVVAPVAPAASGSVSTGEAPPPPPAETGCFARPVTMESRTGRYPRGAVESGMPRRLAACPSAADPDACRAEIARAYYNANLFEEAGPIFLELALAGKDAEIGASAAQLYLDCANILGGSAEPSRPVCYDEIGEQVGPLKARHCPAGVGSKRELCPILDRIEADLERLRAERTVKKADEGGPDALALYRRAGDIYVASFQRRCAFQRPDVKKKPAPPPGWMASMRCDEVAFNAMRAYLAANESALALAARAALLDPDNGLDKGELARRAAATEIR